MYKLQFWIEANRLDTPKSVQDIWIVFNPRSLGNKKDTQYADNILDAVSTRGGAYVTEASISRLVANALDTQCNKDNKMEKNRFPIGAALWKPRLIIVIHIDKPINEIKACLLAAKRNLEWHVYLGPSPDYWQDIFGKEVWILSRTTQPSDPLQTIVFIFHYDKSTTSLSIRPYVQSQPEQMDAELLYDLIVRAHYLFQDLHPYIDTPNQPWNYEFFATMKESPKDPLATKNHPLTYQQITILIAWLKAKKEGISQEQWCKKHGGLSSRTLRNWMKQARFEGLDTIERLEEQLIYLQS